MKQQEIINKQQKLVLKIKKTSQIYKDRRRKNTSRIQKKKKRKSNKKLINQLNEFQTNQTAITKVQVSNLRVSCNFIKQKLCQMHLYHQQNCHFLKYEIINKYKKMNQIKKDRTKKIQVQQKKKKKQIKLNKTLINNQKSQLYCFKFIFKMKQSNTIENKQTAFTQDKVSNLTNQCILLKQNLNLTHLKHQFYCFFLNIEEKIYYQLFIYLEGENEKKV
ncbi:hypothetical protein TTHERM_00618830 (macronuclear) [Tetrahymena thermophila SB210]|uniref:Uncharacterized protein n=1 Tax=Tetrahymena thermophila (strain SB210) TaxID=312017 RepID=Q23MH8_TETTS|nr:hypothetical protein TTHERM_00618830 [Tetrahymena thermophila SB210]EAR97661.2 hypothetical protein TTHERM_00618830 [Tetrahymena thermophila SB210]|eukprot:XP_001017906.2 hypothetical protein TTHERM_00618830 [Tetrahymena thermophila SB210]